MERESKRSKRCGKGFIDENDQSLNRYAGVFC